MGLVLSWALFRGDDILFAAVVSFGRLAGCSYRRWRGTKRLAWARWNSWQTLYRFVSVALLVLLEDTDSGCVVGKGVGISLGECQTALRGGTGSGRALCTKTSYPCFSSAVVI
jgi:hypothetical protein